MIRLGFSSLAIVSSLAAPSDWNGIFSEPLYGGVLNVCVSEVNGDYYGQAVISTLGYMRGTIDASTSTWTGDYYMMGKSTVKGSFSLDLTVSTTNSYTAIWTQESGITYTTSGTQTSTATPDDIACFRVENDYLTGSASFSYSGS